MAWPHPLDYNEAVQAPRLCFADPELQLGQPALSPLGLPWPRSGNSADVYKIVAENGDAWAVKCFTREVRGLRERYQTISSYLWQKPLPFMVDFRYLDQGIRVNGRWFPILKMRWVNGPMLNELARDYATKPIILERLADMWVRLSREMRHSWMVHGDLQHGNVLLVPTGTSGTLRLRLVDYDGMMVPGLADHPPDEVGHPNYQHPRRLSHGAADGDLDRFAHLVIYSALRCLAIGGRELIDRYDNGDNLLFREQDFRAPAASVILRELWDTKHPVARTMLGYLILSALGPLERVPLLTQLVRHGQLRFLTADTERQVAELLANRAQATEPTEVAVENSGGRQTMVADPLALAALLKGPDPRARAGAADQLAAMGPGARAAIPALRQALHDRDPDVRHAVAQALWSIDQMT